MAATKKGAKSAKVETAKASVKSGAVMTAAEMTTTAAQVAEQATQAKTAKQQAAHYDQAQPAIYCGTYHKYNCGSLYGMWVDITTFDDYEEFCDFCRRLHRDKYDPEFMTQDFEYFPESWYFATATASKIIILYHINHIFLIELCFEESFSGSIIYKF